MIKTEKVKIKDSLRWQLGERVKELTALHRTALILNHSGKSLTQTMRALALAIPKAWQYPEITVAKITWAGKTYASPGYKKTRWGQKTRFTAAPGRIGELEICYLKSRPNAYKGPFLKEEVLLLNSLAVMIKTYLQNKIYHEQQNRAKTLLESQIKERTGDLTKANVSLRRELAIGRRRERQIKTYQEQLKRLAQMLSTAEERERREIATDLHDHIGQGLAMIKLKLQVLQGNSVFSGQERDIEEIKNLTRQVIKYTRNLTFELSPLMVYELDLEAALHWLAEHFGQKYKLQVALSSAGRPRTLTEELRIILFKSVRELLMNAVKHGKAAGAEVEIQWLSQVLEIKVRDNGSGFNRVTQGEFKPDMQSFGLFNLKERIVQYSGQLTVDSRPGQGTLAVISVAIKPGEKA